MFQEVIDPEWETIVENHRRVNSSAARGERTARSTIWDYRPSQVTAEVCKPEDDRDRGDRDDRDGVPSTEKCSSSDSGFSFVPSTDTAPGACSPEIIKIDSSSSRQSRSRTRTGDTKSGGGGERKSRLAAFQQIWPQTYNSFQNRAVSQMCVVSVVKSTFEDTQTVGTGIILA